MSKMTVAQKANFANGLLVFTSTVLAIAFDPRFIVVTLFMGASLLFSGVADFCGFALIFKKIDSRS